MTKKLTTGQIVLLVALAILFALVAIGVNRAHQSDNRLGNHEKCVWHALQTGQDSNVVCGNTP